MYCNSIMEFLYVVFLLFKVDYGKELAHSLPLRLKHNQVQLGTAA